ncbi:hypothetical protein GJ496_010462 [Pomphorhynchus laevis]|nr:hypothetical protein GJ496_010462 [Pomphorhynchus laevis]
MQWCLFQICIFSLTLGLFRCQERDTLRVIISKTDPKLLEKAVVLELTLFDPSTHQSVFYANIKVYLSDNVVNIQLSNYVLKTRNDYEMEATLLDKQGIPISNCYKAKIRIDKLDTPINIKFDDKLVVFKL